jgi:acetyl-CoA acetyltransferase
MLAQTGHPVYEVPLGPTIPTYYGLIASRYMHEFGTREEDLAELAVRMRRHAGTHPGAQFRAPITVQNVLGSRAIVSPLKTLENPPDSALTASSGCGHKVPVDGMAVSGVAHTGKRVPHQDPGRAGISLG